MQVAVAQAGGNMHASETIILVYPKPLNLQDQKVSAVNSDP